MASQRGEEEIKHDSPNEDLRALVTALTQQLMMDGDNEAPRATQQSPQSSAEVASFPTTSMGNTGNFSVSNQLFLPL
jgi:hypothetical protein